jgi:hypothetical protein
MDAVISIGGQSFVDGLLRILGPALQPLREPLAVPVPGLTNGVLHIRSIQSVLPSAQNGTIELDLEIDLRAELLLVATVNARALNLAVLPPTALPTVNLPAATGTLDQPLRTLSIDGNNNAGTETGPVGTLAANLKLATNKLTGSLDAAAAAALNLNAIAATVQLPQALSTIPVPLPAVVPVAVNFTSNGPLKTRVFLPPLLNNAAVGAEAIIDGAFGFGLEFSFPTPSVQVDSLAAAVNALQTSISNALTAVASQLLPAALQGLLKPATFTLPPVVSNITNAIPGAIIEVLTEAFSGLRARTGRLIFPAPVTFPPPAPPPSCDVLALPTAGKARIIVAPNGSPILQIGTKRTALVPPPSTVDSFPAFNPAGIVDTGLTVTNTFVLALLECLVEKFPNLSLPTPATLLTAAPPLTATWTGATLTIGPFAFTGTLTLTIAGTPGGTATPTPKTITLAFGPATIALPLITVPAIPIATIFGFTPFSFGPIPVAPTVTVGFTAPISFDLNGVASITGLRPTAAATPTFTLGLGGVIGALTGAAAPFAIALVVAGIIVGAILGHPIGGILGSIAGALVGAIAGGVASLVFLAVTALATAVLLLATGIVGDLLGVTESQVLGGLQRLLESPPALPPGIFEAFGELVPTSVVLDDLIAGGVLRTPTSAWAVIPMFAKERKGPPTGHGGKGGHGPTVPITDPGDIPVTPGGGFPVTSGKTCREA